MVNRAFGATELSPLTGVNDVTSDSWYQEDIQKAVHMGTIECNPQIRPEDKVKRQEVVTILGRALNMESTDSSYSALDKFTDKDRILPWAKASMCDFVEKGIITGKDGKLNPSAYITRAEFAKIMDSIIKQYINKAETVEKIVPTGSVMINAPGVTLKNVTVHGDLIVGDGVGAGEVTLDSVNVTGKVIIRGGGIHSILIKGTSSAENVIIAKVDGNVRVAVEKNAMVRTVVVNDGKDQILIEGNIGTLQVEAPAVPIIVQNATINTVNVNAEGVDLTVAKGSTVANVNVAKNAENAKISVVGTVTSLKNEAPKTDLKVTGEIKNGSSSSQTTGTKSGGSKGHGSSTSAPLLNPIIGTVINGVTPPVTGQKPVTKAADSDEFSATVTWNTNEELFSENTIYTATITITPKQGYTLNGIKENQFLLTGAVTVTNAANAGQITAVFPATEKMDNVGPLVERVKYIDPTHIKVIFNEAVESKSAEDKINYTIGGSFGLDSNPINAKLDELNKMYVILTVRDINLIKAEGFITVYVNGVKDTKENVVDSERNNSSFYWDNLGPSVKYLDIVDNQHLEVYFSEEINTKVAQDIENYELGGTFGLTGHPMEARAEGLQCKTVVLTVDDLSSIENGQTITVKVNNVLDFDNNLVDMEHDTETFVYDDGKDRVGPKIVRLVYVDQNHIKLVFNETLNKASAEDITNYELEGQYGLTGHPRLASLGGSLDTEVTLEVDDISSISSPEDISVTVSNVTDLWGNALDEGDNTADIDIIGPRVVSIEYVSKKQINVIFDKDLSKNTVENVENYILGGSFGLTGHPIQAIFNIFYPNEVILEISDTSAIEKGQSVSVTVKNITDLAGNSVVIDNNTAEFIR